MDNEKKTIKRKLKGEVVSNKMEKTVVVKVDRFKLHPTYQKRYRVSPTLWQRKTAREDPSRWTRYFMLTGGVRGEGLYESGCLPG